MSAIGATRRLYAPPRPTAVYRLFDAQDTLLYVGIARRWIRRLAQHEQTAAFAREIARVEVRWYGCRVAARRAERDAIQHEAPRENTAGTGRAYRPQWPMDLICLECHTYYTDMGPASPRLFRLGDRCGDLSQGQLVPCPGWLVRETVAP